jgi:hypothetical protein
MSVMKFQQEIEARCGRKLKLKINDNRTTMLSVRWDPDRTHVSMHRMFLKAPRNVMEDLACYLNKKSKTPSPLVKAFIEEGTRKLDYSTKLKPSQKHTRGHVYNLERLYEQVNDEYFEGKVKLKITWYGKPSIQRRNKVTFGLYSEPLKLIKIHRLLDNLSVPDYVIKFVIYHEILHYTCPAHVDSNGTLHMHDKMFKKREEEYKHFQLAQEWIEENQPMLFGD